MPDQLCGVWICLGHWSECSSGVTIPSSAHGRNRRPRIRGRVVALPAAQLGVTVVPADYDDCSRRGHLYARGSRADNHVVSQTNERTNE